MSMEPTSSFTRLSSRIMLLDASSKKRPSADSKGPLSPSLIILCTWMGAAPRHVARYTDMYQRLFPDTSLLVIEASLAGMTYRSATALRESLDPAREVVESHVSPASHRGGVVLHAFSNGGAQIATQLAILLQERSDSKGGGGMFGKIILDSCPGVRDAGETARALTIGLPTKYFVQSLATICARIWAVLYFSTLKILGMEDAISSARRRLNDPALFQTSAPRLYLHSRADRIVGMRDVQGHVREARVRGYGPVFEVLFESGGHCGLVLEDAERYWKAVQALVEGSDRDGDWARCVL